MIAVQADSTTGIFLKNTHCAGHLDRRCPNFIKVRLKLAFLALSYARLAHLPKSFGLILKVPLP